MRAGKISETVLKRSVLKKLEKNREEVIQGPGLGVDAAVLKTKEECLLFSAECISEKVEDACFYGMNRALNNLACAGAKPVGILLNILMDPDISEEMLQKFMERASGLCSRYKIDILGGHTQVTDRVGGLLPSFTAVGFGKEKRQEPTFKKEAGLILTKEIALEGSCMLAWEKAGELEGYFNREFVRNAKNFKEKLSILPEAELLQNEENILMHDLSQGGILAGLWEMAERTAMGLEVDLKAVPIRQESVEICEYFSLNPYELLSGGALLIAAENAQELTGRLQKAGIRASIIGRLTSGRDRILHSGEVVSYLNRPAMDNIYKLF